MAHVFLSYAREDRAQAERLAHALGARQWTVWWDREMIPGESIHRVIERELAGAGAVVVLWSKSSRTSDWVKDEATAASEHRTLVPASLDGTMPPLGFGGLHVADLQGWDGQQAHQGFESLCGGIEHKVATPEGPPEISLALPDPPTRPDHGPSSDPSTRPDRRVRALLAVVVVLLLFGGWFVARRLRDTTGAPSPPPASVLPDFARRNSSLGGRDLADVVAGTYVGAVVSDAKGHSQSDVTVTITKVAPRRVRISADYDRLRTVEVDLTRAADNVTNAGGPSLLMLENDTLDFSPDGEVTYAESGASDPDL